MNEAELPHDPNNAPFSDGLTVAGMIGEQKYIDKKGKIIAAYETEPAR